MFIKSLFLILLTYTNSVFSQTDPYAYSLLRYNQNANILMYSNPKN